MINPIHINKFTIKDVFDSLDDGWRQFKAIPLVSLGYSAIFAGIGLLLLVVIGLMGVSPMALPFAGGFMLVGPILLSGFFKLADQDNDNKANVSLLDAVLALTNATKQLWVISLLCAMLFLIWITDAAILYAVMIGNDPIPYIFPWVFELSNRVLTFELWDSVMGSVIAFLIYVVSAFSVPLLYQNRASLVESVTLSVKAVLGNFISSLFLAVFLSMVTIASILILPLFLVTLPVLAFASYSLYKKIFPVEENTS